MPETRFSKLKLTLLFAVSFLIDRLSKSQVEWLSHLSGLGPLYFRAHQNPGFILQSLSEVSAFARVVFVSSLYGFIFFSFFLLHYLLPAPLKTLRVGLTLFFAAITGNCFDRAVFGAVSDFICIDLFDRVVYFNFADVVMWIGTAMIAFDLIRSDRLIWHPNSKRKQYLVNARYQFKWAIATALVALSSTLTLIVFSYTYFTQSSTPPSSNQSWVYLLSAGILGCLFAVLTFFAGVMVSHRSAGPLYAFEKYVESLIQDEQAIFNLRKNDELRHLVPLAEKLRKKIGGFHE